MLSGPIVLSVELRRGVELIVLELIHISGWSYWSSHPVCVVMCVLSGKFCLCVWRRGVGLLLNVSWELGSTTTAQFTAPAHYFHKTTSCVCFKIKHRESSETPSITVLWSKLWVSMNKPVTAGRPHESISAFISSSKDKNKGKHVHNVNS